jgi:L,D-transpeptidase catalytic domain
VGIIFQTFALLVSLATFHPNLKVTVQEAYTLLQSAPDINAQALEFGLQANACAVKRGFSDKNILTIIDFSLPSSKKRLWTFDLDRHLLLFRELVAHGANSGDERTTSFSNEEGSLMSSLGLFRTEEPYEGKNGYSLRITGLEPGFNDLAYSRAVVIHGAWYVSDSMIKIYGRIGRSFGCPAIRQEVAPSFIDTIKEGSLVFAYYPDSNWLKNSSFLSLCGDADSRARAYYERIAQSHNTTAVTATSQ